MDFENLKKLITVKQVNNSIYCDASQILPHVKNIIAYYLFFEKRPVAKKFTPEPSTTLQINDNGSYVVQVFFFDNAMARQFINIDIDCQLIKAISPAELNHKLTISQVNNRIVCNTGELINYINKVTGYYLYRQEELVTKTLTNVSEYSFFLSRNGKYTLKVEYEDIDGITQLLSQDFDFIKQELSSTKLGEFEHLKRQASLRMIYNIIWAFIIREFQAKYETGYFRYFAIILDPLFKIGIMVLLFSLVGRKTILGLSIPIFLLTGLLPYGFFAVATNCLTIVRANTALLNYRQVKIIDIILAKKLMEFALLLLTLCGSLLVIKYFGVKFILYNPLALTAALLILFFLTFGVSLIFTVIGFYFPEINILIQVFSRGLFYVSGVFFSIENIPADYRKYFIWNPLLQVIEYIRFSFVDFNMPSPLSYIYLLQCTIVIMGLGVALYFVNRHRFLVNDKARI